MVRPSRVEQFAGVVRELVLRVILGPVYLALLATTSASARNATCISACSRLVRLALRANRHTSLSCSSCDSTIARVQILMDLASVLTSVSHMCN